MYHLSDYHIIHALLVAVVPFVVVRLVPRSSFGVCLSVMTDGYDILHNDCCVWWKLLLYQVYCSRCTI